MGGQLISILKPIGHNSFEDVPWINRLVDYTAQVLAQDRVRIIGVCFGHQILGRALGVKVGPNDAGWEVAVHDIELSPQGKELFGLENLVSHTNILLSMQCKMRSSLIIVPF